VRRLSLADDAAYREVEPIDWDPALVTRLQTCFAAQRATSLDAAGLAFVADPEASTKVSEAALRDLLDAGRDVRGIATEREITNAIPFNGRNVPHVVKSRKVAALRRAVDVVLQASLRDLFVAGEDPILVPSGHYWYPPGSYMGWHTNSRFPGWRLYLTWAEEPGRAFFRYRDPDNGEIVTSLDECLTLRVFRVSREKPIWHAVYSQTHRFSLGYIVRPWSVRDAMIRRLRAALPVVPL
jgi:hypothetical protein